MSQQVLYVRSNVKDELLIEKRRQQIMDAAIQLFREKGFHKTTTREIALQAGFSSGTLYEYIRSKEDVLTLICDSIFKHVSETVANIPKVEVTKENLVHSISEYFRVVSAMHNEFIILYQETKSLPNEARQYILNKERELVQLFQQVIENFLDVVQLKMPAEQIVLIANQILVVGQSWAFRQWAYKNQVSLDQFIYFESRSFVNRILREAN